MLEIVRRAGGTVTSAELIAGGARWEDCTGCVTSES